MIDRSLHGKALQIHGQDKPAGPDLDRGRRKHYPTDTINYLLELGIQRYHLGERINPLGDLTDLPLADALEILQKREQRIVRSILDQRSADIKESVETIIKSVEDLGALIGDNSDLVHPTVSGLPNLTEEQYTDLHTKADDYREAELDA